MERVIRLGALNIVTQPHSGDRYQQLLLKVKNRKRAARIRGDRFGLIALMSKHSSPNSKGAFVDGLIGAFTQIDEEGQWINLNTGKKAESDELAEVKIPKDLRPNANFHRFRFYLKEHLMVFEIGNSGAKLTPTNAGNLFERLFSHSSLISQFGEVAVTVWPTSDSVQKIISAPGLKSLHLVVFAPNPDDGEEAEKEFRARLESMRARRLEQIIVSKTNQGLKPDAELISDAKVASTNGKVEAIVIQSGRNIKLSTTDTPFIYSHGFSTEVNTEANEFGIAAEIVRHQLRDRE